MKDKELKFEEDEAHHTLDGAEEGGEEGEEPSLFRGLAKTLVDCHPGRGFR